MEVANSTSAIQGIRVLSNHDSACQQFRAVARAFVQIEKGAVLCGAGRDITDFHSQGIDGVALKSFGDRLFVAVLALTFAATIE